eukprot:365315-Chlamydomonas_euryale.AAC.2
MAALGQCVVFLQQLCRSLALATRPDMHHPQLGVVVCGQQALLSHNACVVAIISGRRTLVVLLVPVLDVPRKLLLRLLLLLFAHAVHQPVARRVRRRLFLAAQRVMVVDKVAVVFLRGCGCGRGVWMGSGVEARASTAAAPCHQWHARGRLLLDGMDGMAAAQGHGRDGCCARGGGRQGPYKEGPHEQRSRRNTWLKTHHVLRGGKLLGSWGRLRLLGHAQP